MPHLQDFQFKVSVTEYKNQEPAANSRVRVFVDNNLDYGLFIQETVFFAMLTPAQQAIYRTSDDVTFMVTREVAQAIIDAGVTPFVKQKLRELT